MPQKPGGTNFTKLTGLSMLLPSMKARILVAFALFFGLSLASIQYIEQFGIPFTPLRGRIAEQEASVYSSLNFTADIKKERLESRIREFKYDIRMLSGDLLLRQSVYSLEKDFGASLKPDIDPALLKQTVENSDAWPVISRYLERIISTYPEYEMAEILDVATYHILFSTERDRVGSDLAKYPETPVSKIKQQEPSVTMWQPTQSSAPTLTAAYPIQKPGDTNHSLNYLLIIFINPNDIIRPMLHSGGGLGKTGEAFLIDRNRTIVAPLKYPLPGGIMAKPFEYQINAAPARLAANGEEGIIASEDYRGVPVLAAYRYIPLSRSTGWGMVVKRDKAEVFQSYRLERFQNMLFGLVFILFTIIISSVVADHLTKPLDSLGRTAHLVELGNMNVRANVTGTVETRSLATALNLMLQRIEDRKKELEELVKLRTDQLKEKNQELEQIVYVTSHDLRSPLVNIQGFSGELRMLSKRLVEMLDKEELSDRDNRELDSILQREIPDSLEYIQASVNKIDALLKGLLRLSRLGRSGMHLGLMDMNVLMKEVADSFEYRLQEKDASFVIENLHPAVGDSDQINQVFSNLVDNALKYLDPARKGRITISSYQDEGMVVYCVSDNGIGFHEDFKQKIFEIFHRLDPSESPGEGMGLTIVRKLIERNAGKVWAESEPGKGSKFFVALPSI